MGSSKKSRKPSRKRLSKLAISARYNQTSPSKVMKMDNCDSQEMLDTETVTNQPTFTHPIEKPAAPHAFFSMNDNRSEDEIKYSTENWARNVAAENKQDKNLLNTIFMFFLFISIVFVNLLKIFSFRNEHLSNINFNNTYNKIEKEKFKANAWIWNNNFDNTEECLNQCDFDKLKVDYDLFDTDLSLLDGLELKGSFHLTDLKYFLRSFLNLYKLHVSQPCQQIKLKATKSSIQGLGLGIFFKCENCNFEKWVYTMMKDDKKFPVNQLAVLASLVIGSSYTQCDQFFSGLNMTFMSDDLYMKERMLLVPFVNKAFDDEIIEAGKAEKEIAIQKGQVVKINDKEIPYITVQGDGGYGKRSYKTGSYNSLYGVGVVIGNATKKVLDMEVRNKFCWICYLASKNGTEPKEHECFKNYSYAKSSTSMETDCILKAFQKSIDVHGLIYKTYIGDGDSNTYKSIIENAPYAKYGITVNRLYCYNHLMRNFCNKVVEASNGKIVRLGTKGTIGSFRLFVKKSALRLRRNIIQLIDSKTIKTSLSKVEKVKQLQREISIVVHHTYGDHRRCEKSKKNCAKVKGQKNWIPILRQVRMFEAIEKAAYNLSTKAYSLLQKVTTNACEAFMSQHAKVIGGKRIFLGFRDSYYIRTKLAALQYNTGKVLSIMGRYIKKDLSIAETRELKILNKVEKDREREKNCKPKKRKVMFPNDDGKNYGENHQDVDVSPDELENLIKQHFEKLREMQTRRVEIERATMDQSLNDEWHDYRKIFLTSSNFGRICKMQKTTLRGTLVKEILYGIPFSNEATKYGLRMESEAIKKFEKQTNLKVELSGLCITDSSEKPYFAASLDGKIGDNGCVEIKSPITAKDKTPLQAIKDLDQVRNIFSKNNLDELNRDHKYYYQIQGQLYVTGREYCIFILNTPKGIKCVRVNYDENFWNAKMEPKLTQFYMECLLPEIVDPRVPRNMDVREPSFVTEAIKQREKLKINSKKVVNKNNSGKVKKHEKSKVIDLTVEEIQDHVVENNKKDENDTALNRMKKLLAKRNIKSSNKHPRMRFRKNVQLRMRKNAGLHFNNAKFKPTINDLEKEKAEDKTLLRPQDKIDTTKDVQFVKENNISKVPEKIIQNAKKFFDTRIISIYSVKHNILGENSWLSCDSIDAFMRIQLKRNTSLVSQSVKYVSYKDSTIINGVDSSSIQIIGGNFSHHWRVLHYDGVHLYLYDSLNGINLYSQEKQYMKSRFPQVNIDDLIIKPMRTQQPDGSSCGIYSAAFVESIISGKDPSEIVYSTNVKKMRQHFYNIIQTGKSSPFPCHKIYEDVPGEDFDNDNVNCQINIDLINVDIDKDLVIINVLKKDELLYDEAIQSFLQILQKYAPDFEIHEVQHFYLRKLLRNPEKQKSLQIIGGTTSNHWICIYHDGESLFIYDSIFKDDIDMYGESEKRYIQKRYPGINFDQIKIVPVTNQVDGYSCGTYAAAFATEIAMGSNPGNKNFSQSPMKMRMHFAEIIRTGILVPFPEKRDDGEKLDMYPMIDIYL